LYNGLSKTSKSKVRTHEGIESYAEHEHGVTIQTEKGNVIEGSILVGADGVHSRVRQLMAEHTKEVNPKASQILANGFKTRYRCLTCISNNYFANDPKRPFLRDATVTNTYHPEQRVGILSVAGIKGKIFWNVYIPNENETPYPSPRYTQVSCGSQASRNVLIR
jgi:hypothetical protein